MDVKSRIQDRNPAYDKKHTQTPPLTFRFIAGTGGGPTREEGRYFGLPWVEDPCSEVGRAEWRSVRHSADCKFFCRSDPAKGILLPTKLGRSHYTAALVLRPTYPLQHFSLGFPEVEDPCSEVEGRKSWLLPQRGQEPEKGLFSRSDPKMNCKNRTFVL